MFSLVGTRSTHTFMLSFMKCSQSACTMQQWSNRLVAPASEESAKHTQLQQMPRMARAFARGVFRPRVVAPNDHLAAAQLFLEGTDAYAAPYAVDAKGVLVKTRTHLAQSTEFRGP